MNLIDVSNVNGPVDWHSVSHSNIQGAWLKSSEGETWVDKMFHSNRAAADAAGLRVGAYHFARPDLHPSALAEARNFAGVVGKLGRRDLKPVLDLEVDLAKVRQPNARRFVEQWAREFCRETRRLLGCYPMLYASTGYINDLGLSKPIGNGLWLANYSVNDGHRHIVSAPSPWKKVAAHQFTSVGTVLGHRGHVDRSWARSVRPLLAHPILGL